MDLKKKDLFKDYALKIHLLRFYQALLNSNNKNSRKNLRLCFSNFRIVIDKFLVHNP